MSAFDGERQLRQPSVRERGKAMINFSNFSSRLMKSLLAGAASVTLIAGVTFLSVARVAGQDRPHQTPAPGDKHSAYCAGAQGTCRTILEKAAQYRREAENHTKMLSEYVKGGASLPTERG